MLGLKQWTAAKTPSDFMKVSALKFAELHSLISGK
jgi:hypothetical protein